MTILPFGRVAPASRRVIAYLIDAAIAAGIGIVGGVLLSVIALSSGSPEATLIILLLGWVVLALVMLGWIVWFTIMQSGQGSIGMRAQRLRLVRIEDGGPIGFGRALLRNVIFGLAGSIVVGYFTPLFDGTGRMQGWHDMVGRTLMIEADSARPAPQQAGPPTTQFAAPQATPFTAPPAPAGSDRPPHWTVESAGGRPRTPGVPSFGQPPAPAQPGGAPLAPPVAPSHAGLPVPPAPAAPGAPTEAVRPAAPVPPAPVASPAPAAAPAVPPAPQDAGLIAFVPGVTHDAPVARTDAPSTPPAPADAPAAPPAPDAPAVPPLPSIPAAQAAQAAPPAPAAPAPAAPPAPAAAPAAPPAAPADDIDEDLEATRISVPGHRLVFAWDDGTKVTVSGRTVFGRNPAEEDGATVVAVRDETLSLSKTHFEAAAEASGGWVLDRHSTNGVTIVRDGARLVCTPGERVPVRLGDALEIGDRIVTVGGYA